MMCVVYIISIFFFKQKTAYEMRISDWSSDVCSSDLIIEPCGFPFGDAALKRAGMDYAVRANVRRHPGWDAFRQWSQIGAQRLVQIGRASCRERVCQYV